MPSTGYSSNNITLSRDVKQFVDISLAFEPNPITNDLTVLTNNRAIENSLKNLIYYAPTEIVFDRTIGSGVREYLFDIIDMATASLLQSEIKRVINNFEPRIQLVDLNYESYDSSQLRGFTPASTDGYSIDPRNSGVYVEAQHDQNQFSVTITYRIVGYQEIFRVNKILEPTR